MSNLYKGFAVSLDDSDKRIIDCNAIISEKLVKIKNTLGAEGISEDGFSFGLNAETVSEALADNEHIIGQPSDGLEDSVTEEKIQRKKEIIVAEAQAEADAIVEKANEDANAIIAKAQAEAENIRKQAEAKGMSDGFAKAEADAKISLEKKQRELDALEQELIQSYRKKEEEMEPALVDVILKIFSDMTHAIAMDKRDMILTLVNNVMAGGEASRNFIIRACSEDAIFLRENKEKIEGATRKDIHIEIVTDTSLKRNQCLIDTDMGVYDCSLDIQLENLITDIKILSCTGD